MFPNSLKYTEAHVWVKVVKGSATLGVTEPFLEALGEPIHVELPPKGEKIDAEMGFAEVESAGDTLEALSPVEGTVTAVNRELLEDISLLTRDPYDEGWMVKLKIEDDMDITELMTAAEYDNYVAAEEEDLEEESPFLDMDEDED